MRDHTKAKEEAAAELERVVGALLTLAPSSGGPDAPLTAAQGTEVVTQITRLLKNHLGRAQDDNARSQAADAHLRPTNVRAASHPIFPCQTNNSTNDTCHQAGPMVLAMLRICV